MTKWEESDVKEAAPSKVVDSPKVEKGIGSSNPFGDYFEPAVNIPGVRSFKLGIYGDDKCGKSTLAFNVPRPIYIFSTENKEDITLKQMGDLTDVYYVNIMQKVRDENGDFDKVKAIDYIHDVLQKVKNLEKGTIVFDSYSSVSQWVADWFENSPTVKKDPKTGKPYMFEYGKAKAKYLTIGELLQQTKMNLVCTMWMKSVFNNEGDTGIKIMDAKKGSGYLFEFYGEVMMIGDKRIFKVTGTNYGNLKGFEIENPTFDSIKAAISERTGVKFF
jgi:hypothetical protein